MPNLPKLAERSVTQKKGIVDKSTCSQPESRTAAAHEVARHSSLPAMAMVSTLLMMLLGCGAKTSLDEECLVGGDMPEVEIVDQIPAGAFIVDGFGDNDWSVPSIGGQWDSVGLAFRMMDVNRRCLVFAIEYANSSPGGVYLNTTQPWDILPFDNLYVRYYIPTPNRDLTLELRHPTYQDPVSLSLPMPASGRRFITVSIPLKDDCGNPRLDEYGYPLESLGSIGFMSDHNGIFVINEVAAE
jgi:hypothetical protein